MDPLVSERALAFGEPPVYSSKDFITVQTSERPSDPGVWHKAGSRFSISLRNISQNEMLDTNNMSLQFSVVTTVEAPTGANPAPLDQRLQTIRPIDSAAILPGVPSWGCPFFSSVSAQIPGLGLESFLRTDGESQEQVASRLLCSSGVGSFDSATGRLGYQISGKAYNAGARGVSARSQCLWLNSARGITNAAAGGNIIDDLVYSGTITHYNVPLSLITHLANGLSSMLPIAYFAAGGDLMTFTFNLAPASSALNAMAIDRPDLSGAATYYVIDPAISFTKTQINNPSVLSGIEALYRGVASLPIAQGISAPMAMTLKDIDYSYARTTVNGASGAFQLTIPANEPSMRGLLLKFACQDLRNCGLTSVIAQPYNATDIVGTQWNGKHAFTLVPRLRNLVVRIGSYRVPLDAISDIRYSPVNVPGLNGVNPFASFQGPTESLDCLSTQREAARMYSQGKHLFSPFMSGEHFEDDALAPFWATPVSRGRSAGESLFVPGVTTGERPSYQLSSAMGTGLFVIPFESFAAVLNHRSDAFALRGIDLRNITSITVSGTIEGVSSGFGPGLVTSPGITPTTSGWNVSAMAAFDREIVVLPGRIDTAAQFSLIPTGATAVPTV